MGARPLGLGMGWLRGALGPARPTADFARLTRVRAILLARRSLVLACSPQMVECAGGAGARRLGGRDRRERRERRERRGRRDRRDRRGRRDGDRRTVVRTYHPAKRALAAAVSPLSPRVTPLTSRLASYVSLLMSRFLRLAPLASLPSSRFLRPASSVSLLTSRLASFVSLLSSRFCRLASCVSMLTSRFCRLACSVSLLSHRRPFFVATTWSRLRTKISLPAEWPPLQGSRSHAASGARVTPWRQLGGRSIINRPVATTVSPPEPDSLASARSPLWRRHGLGSGSDRRARCTVVVV